MIMDDLIATYWYAMSQLNVSEWFWKPAGQWTGNVPSTSPNC